MTSTGVAPSKQGRIHSLDGLRGLAATVVLLHHSLLVIPSLASPYFEGQVAHWSWEWWAVNTPLHLLWEGTGAVYVFFILSGLVLAKPVSSAAGRFDWKAFYPQRVIRLYIPVWAAVVFAMLTFFIAPRGTGMASEWIQHRPEGVSVNAFLRDVTLVFGNGGLASPLWSLRWEILFSLLLPLFIWAAHKARRHPILGIAGCVVVAGLGDLSSQDFLRYMPMFMIGILLLKILEARHAESHTFWLPLLTIGLLSLNLRWLTVGLPSSEISSSATFGLAVLGACLVVAAAALYPPAKRFLSTRPLLWLGKISFSLYLVHEPAVIAVAFIFGPGNELLAVPVAIVVSLIVGAAFFRVVERPSYRLARLVGRKFASPNSPRKLSDVNA